jgi:hypothetical protein
VATDLTPQEPRIEPPFRERAEDEVAADVHPGLPVTEGLSFGVEGIGRDRLLERWHAQIASLGEA